MIRVPPTMGGLRVDADLQIEVAGRRASLVGTGDRLRLIVDEPAPFFTRLAQSTPDGAGARHSLVVAADNLCRAGLTVDVIGNRGVLASVGRGPRSGFGRVLFGSPGIQPGPLRVVIPAVVQMARFWLHDRRR